MSSFSELWYFYQRKLMLKLKKKDLEEPGGNKIFGGGWGNTVSSFRMTWTISHYSNLLRPAGVQLQPSTFQLNLYRAEDIPRSKSLSLCWGGGAVSA